MRKGKLFVFSGPSASGKGTICRELLKEPGIWLSVSLTTRQPREGEVHGTHYFFVSREEYEQVLQEGGFLEHAQIYGNCYGTPKKHVLEHMEKGYDVILEIEMQGALQVKAAYPEAVLIFVLPPSLEELRCRIAKRGSETRAQVGLRMAESLSEIEKLTLYDYFIINDRLEDALLNSKAIIRSEHCKVSGAAKALIKRYKEEK